MNDTHFKEDGVPETVHVPPTNTVDSAPKIASSAYIIVVPDPVNTVTCGIRRWYKTDTLGEYYFWMKIGDSSKPKQRLSQYKDPDRAYAVVNFTDVVGKEKPGKALELKHLEKHIQGGLSPGATTEWRALCARTKKDAFKLRERLCILLRSIDEKPHTYKEASELIETAVSGTCTGAGEARTPGESYSWVSIVVQPRIDKQQKNWGFSILNEPNEFRVSVRSSITKWDTVEGLVKSQYANLCPDISYNALRLPGNWSRAQCEQASLSIVTRIGKAFNCLVPNISDPEWDGGWFTIQVADDDHNKLAVLVDLLEEFQDLALEGTEPKSSKPAFI
ncbi:hypothetical protein FRC08_009631 [Ceratobasidium sp. 394]|nr:hypothetical protein FRC08_009631 [Ceratobasidium sp. 394]KAG9091482.1 hypothetical protein FS749_016516 [Ceratobasidium sp. UAMH 11750]